MQRVTHRYTPRQVPEGLGALQPLARSFVNEANAAMDQANAAVSKAEIVAALERLRPAYTNIFNSIKDNYIPASTYAPLRDAMAAKINHLISWYNAIVAREQAAVTPPPPPPPPPPPMVQPQSTTSTPGFITTAMQPVVDAVKAPTTNTAPTVVPLPAGTPAPVDPRVVARGVIDAQTSAIKGILERGIRPELFPQGFQLYEMEPQMWKMIQYTESNYACVPENVLKTAFRADIYTAAQRGLADLLALLNAPPFNQPLPPTDYRDKRLAMAQLYADWFTCVYTWVSIAHFAANIQPAYLNVDSAETPIEGGQKVPTKTPGDGLPSDLGGTQRELVGLNNDMLKKFADAFCFGPTWAECYTTGEATSWLRGDFAPVTDPLLQLLTRTWGDNIDGVYPENYVYGKTLTTEYDSGKIKARILDPWFFWYVTFAHRPIDELGSPWTKVDKRAVRDDATTRFWLPGPAAMLKAARAWANSILTRSLAEQITRSAGWYLTNYVPYWTNLLGGNIEITIDEVRASQKAAAAARATAKQQSTSAIVNAALSTTAGIAASVNPIAGGVAAGVSLLAKGVMRLAFWRRRRKNKPKYDLMQPLMLRTLSDPDCSFFPRDVSLPESLTRVLTVVQAEIGDPAMTATLPKITPLAPASQPATAVEPMTGPTTVAAQTTTVTTPATPPITPPANIQGGSTTLPGVATTAEVRTSNAAALPVATAMPTPRDTQVAIAAAAQRPLEPTATAPAPSRQINWPLVAAGAASVAVFVSLRRR